MLTHQATKYLISLISTEHSFMDHLRYGMYAMENLMEAPEQTYWAVCACEECV